MREPDFSILSKLRPPTTKRTPRKSYVGQVFTRLTVYALMGYHKTRERGSWLCLCECGEWRIIPIDKLTRGLAKSCGCYRTETRGNNNRTHGMSKTLPYRRWADMITRCTNPEFKEFHNYGGRGIKVCERWIHSFENYLADMGPPPDASYQIERMNNDGDYAPENCKWATQTEQSRNKRDTRWITIGSQTKSMAEWVETSGVRQSTAWKRLERGWTPEEAFGFKERLTRVNTRVTG